MKLQPQRCCFQNVPEFKEQSLTVLHWFKKVSSSGSSSNGRNAGHNAHSEAHYFQGATTTNEGTQTCCYQLSLATLDRPSDFYGITRRNHKHKRKVRPLGFKLLPESTSWRWPRCINQESISAHHTSPQTNLTNKYTYHCYATVLFFKPAQHTQHLLATQLSVWYRLPPTSNTDISMMVTASC